MKRFLIIMAILMVASFAFADSYDGYPLEVADISTNAVAIASDQNTSGIPFTGFVEGIILDFTGYASATVDVDIVTVEGVGSGAERTIYSADSLTFADEGYLPIRIPVVSPAGTVITSTNVLSRIPLMGDKLLLKAYDAVATNAIGLKAHIILQR